ncbi:MAG: pitrilysin family protein [Bdellovibrio sp.]
MRKFFLGSILTSLAAGFLTLSCTHKAIKAHVDGEEVVVDQSLDVKKKVLPNGLKILVVENHRLPIISYYTFYNVGGRHEGPGTTGATHFLEHMMFKGAKKFGPGDFERLIESNGGSSNAYTTFDSTVYYQNAPSTLIETIVDLEADRMENLLLEPASFERERQVVKEERKMRYENSPGGQLYLRTNREVYKGTPYGGSVIGDVVDLDSLNRDQVMDFFKKFYTPDNAIIVVVGDVEANKVFDLIESKMGNMKPSSEEVREYKKQKDNKELFMWGWSGQKEVKLKGESSNPLFILAFKAVPLGEDMAYAQDFLSNMLSSGDSSFLVQEFVKSKNPSMISISSGNSNMRYSGMFTISGELMPKKSLAQVKKDLLMALKKSCNEIVTERNLQKARNNLLASYYGSLQTNAGVAHFLGQQEYYFGDYNYYKTELQKYLSINLEQVKAACHEIADSKDHIFVSVWDRHPN